jgi:hypothetical protein
MQDEDGSEVPDFQDCFDGADIFFRSKDKERFRLSLEAVKNGERGLALIGANEGVLDHYSRILVSRLREIPGFNLEVFLPNDTDSLLNRFNQILAKMTMEQARKPADPSAQVHLLVVNDARSVKQEQWNLLARLISDFPGTNVRLVLCIDKTGWPGYEKLLPMFGRQLYRWVVDTPTVDEAIQLTYAAQEYGYERDTDLLLEQVGLGDVVAPDNSEIMPGDIDILSEDTLMQDIGGGLVFSEGERESNEDPLIPAGPERREARVVTDDSSKLRDIGVTIAISVLSFVLVCFIFYRLYPTELLKYKEAVVLAVEGFGRSADEASDVSYDQSPIKEIAVKANSGEGENGQWTPVEDQAFEANDVQEKLKEATPSSATSEALLAQVSAEFSEDTLGSSEVSEVEETRDLGVSAPDETESTVIFSDEEITALIEDLEQEQQFDSEQDNPSLADQIDGEPELRRQEIEAVEQVRSLEEMASLEQVEQISLAESPTRLEELADASEEMLTIQPVEEVDSFIDNEILAPSRNRIPEAVESVEGSRSGDFFVQYIVFTSEAQATEFIGEHLGLAKALVVPIFLRGNSAFAVVAGPFSSLADARGFAGSEQLPQDYWFRSANQLKAALRVNRD